MSSEGKKEVLPLGARVILATIVGLASATLWPQRVQDILHFMVIELPWLGHHGHITVAALGADVLLAPLFWYAGVELKEEMTHGSLNSFSKAALPGSSTFGGVIVPAAMFWATTQFLMPAAVGGFIIPTATDIVFAEVLGRTFFKNKPVARVMLLAIAVLDDVLALVNSVIFYSDPTVLLPGLLVTVAIFAAVYFVGRQYGEGHDLKILYLFAAAAIWLLWAGIGLHPALSLFFVGVAMPATKKSHATSLNKPHELFENDDSAFIAWTLERVNPLTLPLFALIASAVTISSLSDFVSPLAIVVTLSLVIGKVLGIGGSAHLAIKRGWCDLPEGMAVSDFYKLGACAGPGFTVSIFVSGLAYPTNALFALQAKLGAIMSLPGSALAAWAIDRRQSNKPESADTLA